MKIINNKLLATFRQTPACEICHDRARCQPHHIICRGAGGGRRLDVRINLVAVCVFCHARLHGGSGGQVLRVEELLTLVAHRERISVDVDLLSVLWWLLRLDGKASATRAEAALSELGEAEQVVARDALKGVHF